MKKSENSKTEGTSSLGFYKELFHTLFHSSKDGIVIGKNGVIFDYNQNFLEMFDLEDQDLKGKKGIDFVGDIDTNDVQTKNKVIDAITAVYSGKCPQTFNIMHEKKDQSIFYGEITLSLFEFDETKYICVIIHDATKVRNIQEELKEQNILLKTVISNSQLGIWDWNLKSNELYFDDNYYNMLGYNKEEFTPGFSLWENYIHEDDKNESVELLNAHREGLIPYYESTFRIKSKSGEWRWILDKGKAVEWDEDGNTVRIIGTHQDITKLKEIDLALKDSEKNYRTLVETSKDLIFKINLKGDLVFYNESARRELELLPIDDKTQINIKDIVYEEDLDKAREILKLVVTGEHVYSTEFRIQDKTRNISYIQISASPIFSSAGEIQEILVTGRDITEQREAEMILSNNLQHLEIVTQDLQSSLKEKQSLLREIHHRVKNNLQIISAITLMHEKSAITLIQKNFFKDFQQRIKAMSKIHETLYRSDDLEKMNLSDYIPDLVRNLTLSYSIDASRIKCVFSIEKLMMSLNNAMHIGLIVNELVSNAFKYAFPKKRNGEILIKIQLTDRGKVILQVKDDGVGFPDDIDFSTTESMGLRIVRTSTKQLKGKILLEKKDGTDWIIIFDENRLLHAK